MLSKSTWELGYYYAVAYVCINQKFEFKIIAFCGAGVNWYSHATRPDQTKLSGLSQSERSRFRLALWNTEDPFSLGYYFFSRLRIYKYNRYVTTQHTLNMMLYNEIRFSLSCSLSLSLSLFIYFHFLAGFCYHAFSKMILFRNSGWWARCTFVCVSVCIALIAMDLINSNSSNIAIIRVKSRQTADKL